MATSLLFWMLFPSIELPLEFCSARHCCKKLQRNLQRFCATIEDVEEQSDSKQTKEAADINLKPRTDVSHGFLVCVPHSANQFLPKVLNGLCMLFCLFGSHKVYYLFMYVFIYWFCITFVHHLMELVRITCSRSGLPEALEVRFCLRAHFQGLGGTITGRHRCFFSLFPSQRLSSGEQPAAELAFTQTHTRSSMLSIRTLAHASKHTRSLTKNVTKNTLHSVGERTAAGISKCCR